MQASGAPNRIGSRLAPVARLQRLSNSRDSLVQVFDSLSHVCEHFGFENLDPQALVGGVLVAHGGFASVYRGELENITVAVKLLRVTEKDDKGRILKRLAREALVLKSVDDPHVAKFYGVVELNGWPALVMEWYDQGTAADYLQDKNPEQKLAVVKDAAHGLEYLHAQDIIHGDMKGNNVLITHAGRAVVSDFGLSRILDIHTGTTTSTMPGSIRYQSPELIPSCDLNHQGGPILKIKASDVWAFGCTAFELLLGNLPYSQFKSGSPFADICVIAEAIRKGMPPGDLQLVPACIKDIFEQCWKFQPSERPTMTTVVKMLS